MKNKIPMEAAIYQASKQNWLELAMTENTRTRLVGGLKSASVSLVFVAFPRSSMIVSIHTVPGD